MLIERLDLKNFLSFGPDSEPLNLGALNVLIGPNGSGKSNILEALGLLRAAPQDYSSAIRNSGTLVRDWIWRQAEGAQTGLASLRARVRRSNDTALLYGMSFTEVADRFELIEEFIARDQPQGLLSPSGRQDVYQLADTGVGLMLAGGVKRQFSRTDLEPNRSVLAQFRDPIQYPEISALVRSLDGIRIYRDFRFGREMPARRPQDAAAPNDQLLDDCSNLGLVLNRLALDPKVKAQIVSALRVLYGGIDDYGVIVNGGTVQVFLSEGGRSVPATRLSDGTLRYLCLLAILCHPNPPPLVAIEEPELGLHPDVIPTLADLLRKASTRGQIVVTTHSDALVDAMSDEPESVVVVERGDEGTHAHRLIKAQLQPWLAEYRLGQLWSRGQIGGNRW